MCVSPSLAVLLATHDRLPFPPSMKAPVKPEADKVSLMGMYNAFQSNETSSAVLLATHDRLLLPTSMKAPVKPAAGKVRWMSSITSFESNWHKLGGVVGYP